jgi:FMN phosphatase YigB (HAD superfamily)
MNDINSQDIDAVVFDLGGVLVKIDFLRVFKHWAEQAGCDVTAIADRFAMDHHYEKHERGETSTSEYFAALRDSLGIRITDGQFLEGWNQIFVSEVADMRRIVQLYAASYPVYVFSNSNEAHKATWMRCYSDLLKPFQRVFVSSDIGKRKPDLDAYRHVAAAIGAEPQRILFFDDSAQNIEGAAQAGLIARKVNSVADVEKVFKKLAR